MITEYQPEAVRFDGERPVAAGDQPLSQPTRVVRTAAGFWGLFVAGDDLVVVHPAGALRGRLVPAVPRRRRPRGGRGRAGRG